MPAAGGGGLILGDRPARRINEAGDVAEVVCWSTGQPGVSWPIGYGCTVYSTPATRRLKTEEQRMN